MKRNAVAFPLRYKLLIFYIAILTVALVFSGSLVSFRYRELFAQSEKELSMQMLQRMQGSLFQYMQEIDRLSISIAFHPTILDITEHYKENRFIGMRAEESLMQNLFGIDWKSSRDILYFHLADIEANNVLAVGTMLRDDHQRDLAFLQSGERMVWKVQPNMRSYNVTQSTYSVISFYRLVIDPEQMKTLGLLCFDIPVEALSGKIRGFDWAEGISIALWDKHGAMIWQSDTVDDGTEQYSLSVPVGDEWTLTASLPSPAGSSQAAPLQSYQLIVLMLCAIFGVLLIALVSQIVLRPLRRLSDRMQNVKKGDLSTKVVLHSRDEIASLAGSFNDMLDAINELIAKNLAIEKAERQTEVKLLQAQINPHFLYNTLDAIRWQARSDGNPIIEQQVQALSHMFRQYLQIGSEYISFENEVTYLKDYMTLMQFRYDAGIAFTLDVAEVPTPCYLLKMLLQPLLENALSHGFSEDIQEGTISLCASVEEGRLLITVTDNGRGANERRVQALARHPQEDGTGFALGNLQERLRLHYGSPYGLHFVSEWCKGTCVTLTLPLITQLPPHPPEKEETATP